MALCEKGLSRQGDVAETGKMRIWGRRKKGGHRRIWVDIRNVAVGSSGYATALQKISLGQDRKLGQAGTDLQFVINLLGIRVFATILTTL